MASDTELWRGTDYGWWLAADTSGAVGASLIAFAVPLIMLATTGSSAAATTTESICVVVQTVLGLAGGVIQDRYDRRTLMLIWGASGVVLSAVAAAAVMLFGNAPKTSGHGVNGANAPAFGGPYAHVLPIALLCIVVLFSVRDGLLENTSNATLTSGSTHPALGHRTVLIKGIRYRASDDLQRQQVAQIVALSDRADVAGVLFLCPRGDATGQP